MTKYRVALFDSSVHEFASFRDYFESDLYDELHVYDVQMLPGDEQRSHADMHFDQVRET